MPFVMGYLQQVDSLPPMPGSPGVPTHPIVYPPEIWGPPNMPPGFWGGGMGPGVKPPPIPAHPIVIPPDAIAPGVPTHPIYIPIYPAHPIVIPPGAIAPGVPTHPIVLPPPHPAHPIVIPPDSIAPGVPSHPIALPGDPWWGTEPPTQPPSGGWEWVYSPIYGWVLLPPGEGGKPQPPSEG